MATPIFSVDRQFLLPQARSTCSTFKLESLYCEADGAHGYREINVLKQRMSLSLWSAKGKLVGAVCAIECRGREVGPLRQGDGVVKTNLGGLCHTLRRAPGVAAHWGHPGGRRGETVCNVLPLSWGRIEGRPVEEQEVGSGNLRVSLLNLSSINSIIT